MCRGGFVSRVVPSPQPGHQWESEGFYGPLPTGEESHRDPGEDRSQGVRTSWGALSPRVPGESRRESGGPAHADYEKTLEGETRDLTCPRRSHDSCQGG